MKLRSAVFLVILMSITGSAGAAEPSSKDLYGKWEWTLSKNNCTEIYHFRSDNTSVVISGDEIGESRFTVTDKPNLLGFFIITDVVTKSNGRTGCDGTEGGTPVGDAVSSYLFFNSTKDQIVFCREPNFSACMGPLRRIPETDGPIETDHQ